MIRSTGLACNSTPVTPRSVPSRISDSRSLSAICTECRLNFRHPETNVLNCPRVDEALPVMPLQLHPSPTLKCHSCDLIHQIDGARKWTAVQELVSGCQLEPASAVFALHHLRRLLPLMTASDLADLKASDLLKQLASVIQKGVTHLQPNDVVRALVAFAEFAENPSDLISRLALRARECQSGLSGTDIAGTFWACAVLKAPVPSGLLPAMETNLVPLISSLTPADVRNVWHGYAIQQQLPSSECIEALMGHTEEHFARYKRSQLGDCLQYWAQLRIVPNPVLMSRLKVMAENRAERPVTLLDRGSVGPNPMFHPALYADGLPPAILPRIRIPGDYMYDDTMKQHRRYRKIRIPPRAPQSTSPAAPLEALH